MRLFYEGGFEVGQSINQEVWPNDILLPIVVCRVGETPLTSGGRLARWSLDTCYGGSVITSASQLLAEFGLAAVEIGGARPAGNRPFLAGNGFELTHYYAKHPNGDPDRVPCFDAEVWLAGNRGEFVSKYFRLFTPVGIGVRAERQRSLIGRKALIATGLRVDLLFEKEGKISIYVPDVDNGRIT